MRKCLTNATKSHVLSQGPIVSFNMMRSDGTSVGYAEVQKLASVNNIHLRTGESKSSHCFYFMLYFRFQF